MPTSTLAQVAHLNTCTGSPFGAHMVTRLSHQPVGIQRRAWTSQARDRGWEEEMVEWRSGLRCADMTCVTFKAARAVSLGRGGLS